MLAQALTRRYDLAFNVVSGSSSGRLFTKWTNAKVKVIENDPNMTTSPALDSTHMGKVPVWTFRTFVLGEKEVTNEHAVYPLSIRMTDGELNAGHDVLRRVFNNEKRTIALYTYATGSKKYPPIWWQEFLVKLKGRFPGHNFLEILPIENVSQLLFSIPSFYSRDIREIASVIANSAVFIGADSGIMHLASASGTPTIGLFKVTALGTYAPYGNGSRGIDTEKSGLDGIVSAIADVLFDGDETRSKL